MMWSHELGVSTMQGIQNIAVINGKPSIYGDLSMALLWQSGLVEEWQEWHEGSGDSRTAIIKSKRKDVKSVIVKSFSLEEAKKAGLADKDVWKKYTDDMLMWRTRGRMFDALYADVQKGLILVEEAQDYPEPKGPVPLPEQHEEKSVEKIHDMKEEIEHDESTQDEDEVVDVGSEDVLHGLCAGVVPGEDGIGIVDLEAARCRDELDS